LLSFTVQLGISLEYQGKCGEGVGMKKKDPNKTVQTMDWSMPSVQQPWV
jgi:hypothetical protein